MVLPHKLLFRPRDTHFETATFSFKRSNFQNTLTFKRSNWQNTARFLRDREHAHLSDMYPWHCQIKNWINAKKERTSLKN